MLVLLRVIFTGLFIFCVAAARRDAAEPAPPDDLTHASWLVLGVLSGLACSAAWAPFLGAKIADPLTGGMVESPLRERKNRLLQLIRWCDKRHKSAAVRWLCFLEGVRAPWLPTAFILGLKNARRGSWLEKIYAAEVFRFSNAQNCAVAYDALQRRGIDPLPHPSPEVNIFIMSKERQARPEPGTLIVPPAPPPPPVERDRRIRLGKN